VGAGRVHCRRDPPWPTPPTPLVPPVFAIAALVLLPLSVLLLSWQTIDLQIWSHLLDTQMSRLLGNTLTLVLGVGVGVTCWA
jgi:iron(III) transport system permease protein